MRLKILDQLQCPKCVESGQATIRKYMITGDFNQVKIFDGFVTCTNKHRWQIRDELLKFDKESKENDLYDVNDIEYGDVEKYPSEFDKLERPIIELIDSMVEKAFAQGKIIALFGFPLLFLERIKKVDRPLVVVDPDEKVLRKAQEISAKNGFYDSLSVVKSEKPIVFSEREQFYKIGIFSEWGDMDIALEFNGTGKEVWSIEGLKITFIESD